MQWSLANNNVINLDQQPQIMGILNVTPDSFSDGGQYENLDIAVKHVNLMLEQGASIIDIGGESTRPGSVSITSEVEQSRVLPVLYKIKENNKNTIVSVDTYNSDTAEKSLRAGADLINDVFGLQHDENMAAVIAEHNAGVVIMHTNRNRKGLDDVIEDQKVFFDKSLQIASKAGIKESKIVLDPGFGFAKDFSHNVSLFKRVQELHCYGLPLVAATSRKRFLGQITQVSTPSQRDVATAATSILLREKGFSIFRVHDVLTTKQSLDIYDALVG